MTNIQLLNFKPVLESLSNYQKEIDGKLIILSYNFSGSTRLKIAKNIRTLARLLTDIEFFRKNLLNKYENISSNSIEAVQIEQEFQAVLLQESSIKLETFTLEELALDENPIPANTLAILLDLVV